MRRWGLLAGGLLFAIGCESRRRSSTVDSPSTSVLPRVAKNESVGVRASLPTALPGISPHAVLWDADGVAARLRSAGFAARVDPNSVREPFLRPVGARIIVRAASKDSAEVLSFFYGGPIEAGRDIATLDTETASPKNAKVAWRAPAALVTNNNLVAIGLAEDAGLRRKIRDALRVSGGR